MMDDYVKSEKCQILKIFSFLLKLYRCLHFYIIWAISFRLRGLLAFLMMDVKVRRPGNEVDYLSKQVNIFSFSLYTWSHFVPGLPYTAANTNLCYYAAKPWERGWTVNTNVFIQGGICKIAFLMSNLFFASRYQKGKKPRERYVIRLFAALSGFVFALNGALASYQTEMFDKFTSCKWQWGQYSTFRENNRIYHFISNFQYFPRIQELILPHWISVITTITPRGWFQNIIIYLSMLTANLKCFQNSILDIIP